MLLMVVFKLVFDNQFCLILFLINRVVTNFFANLKQYTTKKIYKSVLNTAAFYLKGDNNEEVTFNA